MDWDLLGHEWAAHLLQQHVARQEARHAYLFAGPPGAGRRSLALRFAQAINCTQPPQPGIPCRSCRNCSQIERLQHPDLSILQSDPDNRTIKVEAVRELQRSLSLAPYQAGYRVALLLRFQDATPSAQNALLKTLEEAPPRVILLLTADSPDVLLPTIVSRCEVLRLRPLAPEALAAALQERWKLPADQARQLAHLSGGRVGQALQLHNHPELLEQHQAWIAEGFDLLTMKRRERFAYVEKLTKDGDRDKLRAVLQAWLSLWRDVMLAAASMVAAGTASDLANLRFESQIRQLGESTGLPAAAACTAAVEKALLGLDLSLNARLLLEVLMLDWPHLS